MDVNVYVFTGPVTLFGKVISNKWYGETTASSEKKALSNLKYQFKKESNLVPGSKIDLIGCIKKK